MMEPRYPELQIRLSSSNPFVWVSAARLAMRRSRIDSEEIAQFTDEALESDEPVKMRDVCARWVRIGLA